MKILGIEDRIHDEVPLSKLVLRSNYIELAIESLTTMYSENIKQEIDVSQIDTSGFKIEPITPAILFQKLRKPILEVHEETCVYTGKLTPFFYCKLLKLDKHTDLYAADLFMTRLWGPIHVIRGSSSIGTAIEQLVWAWVKIIPKISISVL